MCHGKGGQKLIPETIPKIKALKGYASNENLDIDIEVDGGVNSETAEILKEAGANILVVGSYLVFSDNKKEIVENLKNK